MKIIVQLYSLQNAINAETSYIDYGCIVKDRDLRKRISFNAAASAV